jgi:hypothetical protein
LDGSQRVGAAREAECDDEASARALGTVLAEEVIAQGARGILQELAGHAS